MSLVIDVDLQRHGFNLSVNTSIPSTGINAIYGPSGAGKTTLLRWLAGLDKQIHGTLHFKQQCWQNDHDFLPAHQREIAFVFQEPRLFPHLTVRGNLHYAYKRRFNNNGPCIDDVCQWFELNSLLEHRSAQLSGGQQQRVAIARSLLSSPQLILMDEPLSSLDVQSKQRIMFHLEKLHQHLPAPLLYVSHDIEEIHRLADYVLLIENGSIRAQEALINMSSKLDLDINHQENAASILEATVRQHDQHYQLTELALDCDASTPSQSLFLTQNGYQCGEKIRVRVPARDVSISLHQIQDSSILNSLFCTIDAIENTLDARVLIRLKLANQYLLARLTRKSVDRLQLQVGQTVYAHIKSVALLHDNYSVSPCQ